MLSEGMMAEQTSISVATAMDAEGTGARSKASKRQGVSLKANKGERGKAGKVSNNSSETDVITLPGVVGAEDISIVAMTEDAEYSGESKASKKKSHGGSRKNTGRKVKPLTTIEKADLVEEEVEKVKEQEALLRLAYMLGRKYLDNGQTFIEYLYGMKSE